MNKQELSRSMVRPDCWNTAFETELKSRLLKAERKLEALRTAAERFGRSQHWRQNYEEAKLFRAAIEAAKP